MAEGWYKSHRKMFDNPLFDILTDEGRRRLCAWQWLLCNAAWKDTRKDIKGKTIVVKRGQVTHSIRFLATAWGCSPKAVQRMLRRFKGESMIATATATGQTIITICNYEKYQIAEDAPATGATTGGPQEGHKLEEGKNVRRKERTPSPVSNTETPPDRIIPTHTGAAEKNSAADNVVDLESKKPPRSYAFYGDVIRLNRKDYDSWKNTYHAIPDFDAMLERIDAYYGAHPEKQKNWFFRVPGWLNDEHQKKTKKPARGRQAYGIAPKPDHLKKPLGDYTDQDWLDLKAYEDSVSGGDNAQRH